MALWVQIAEEMWHAGTTVHADRPGGLDAGVTLWHHRAGAVALEMIGDPAAAEGRAKLLGQTKMTGVGGFMRKTNAFPALIVA